MRSLHKAPRIKMHLKLLASALGTTAALLTTTTNASVLLEEVVVTAQKREQSLQDVGIAITAFTGDQLNALGITESKDIARITPGLHIGGNVAGQNSMFTIRGVTQNDFSDHTESPVAVYVDDTYIAMAQGQTFALFDLERTEVLKGPQGTLFGRNATGGLLHFVTEKPTDEFEGYIDLEYGAYDKIRIVSAVGGPLSDSVAGRLSVLYDANDGYINNQYPLSEPFPNSNPLGGSDDLGNEETNALRGHLLFDINEDAELLLTAAWAESELSAGPYQSTPSVGIFEDANGNGIADRGEFQAGATALPSGSTAVALDTDGNPIGHWLSPAPVRPVPGGDFFGYIDPDGDGWDTSTDMGYDDLNSFETTMFSAKLTWDLGGVSLIAITDWKDYDKLMGMDVDASPVNQWQVWFNADTSQFSQEIRLQGETEKMRWTTGFYYLNVDAEVNNGWKFLPGALFNPAFDDSNAISEIEQETDSWSVFGQIDYDLTEALVLTAGLRIIQENKDFSFEQNVYENNGDTHHFDTGVLRFPMSPLYKGDSDDTLWAGKIQLDWNVSPDLLLYAGINRGIKAGGFNAPHPLFAPDPSLFDTELPYDGEELTSYAAGFKWTLGDGATRINGELYYYDYKDYQAFLFVGASGTISNQDADTIGGELEIISSPVDGLDLMFGVALFDAQIDDFAITPNVVDDVDPAYAPELQIMGLIRYAWPFLEGELAAQYDFSYSDSFYDNLRNFDDQKHDDYTIQNTRLTYTTNDKSWEVAAFLDNLADERYATIGFSLPSLCGCTEIAYGTPRWWGVKVRRNF